MGKRGPKPANPDRDEKIVGMFRQGLCLETIGQQFGITRERVRQIVKKAGLTRSDGGFTKRAQMKTQAKRRRSEVRVLAKWGLDLVTWRELRANGVIRAFEQHRKNSKARGIAFKLSFPEWYAVWQTSGKIELMGRGKGRYCMSRISDSGCYEVGNVHVQLAVENSREATKKWIGKTKANPGVYHLYPGTARPWMAKVGKARLGFFATEAEAVAARAAHIAENGVKTNKAGSGRGWTYDARCTKRPYQAQGLGVHLGSYATQEEAEAAYLAHVERVTAERAIAA